MQTSLPPGCLSTIPGAVVNGEWRLGIGDPTLLGWATTAAYLAACVLCFRAFTKTRQASSQLRHSGLRPYFWLALGLLLLLLGINKQLDLQSWFTQVGKRMALEQGWYDQRRVYQRYFIFGVGMAGYAGLLGMYWLVRGAARDHLYALIGIAFLVCFVLMRAASFHHFDRLIRMGVGPLKMNHLLENAGILCVAAAACRAHRFAVKLAALPPAPPRSRRGGGTPSPTQPRPPGKGLPRT